ncbi:ATP-binding protein [Methyloversatilis thermotolerans]|uniref:ATP-binding protein n=1 Tax=Methyloversatilis thermotolerans TaxID=1346290 RepID=UPI00037B087B|nr:ATP-binding protein [Methyloversatilis thermotolerans]
MTGAVPAPPLPDDIDARILREQVDSMMRTSWSGAIAAFVVGLGFWSISWAQTGDRGALLWAALLHSCQLWRYLGCRRYLRTPAAARDAHAAGNWYARALLLNASIWGLAPWLFFPEDSPLVTALMMLVLLGMTTGSIASLAPHRRALLSFPIPVMLGLSSAMLWQGGALELFMGVSALVYLYVNLDFGLQQHRLLTEALRSRYEKEALARQLEEQIEIARRASAERIRFFASASHDLRQPLHSLGLFGTALERRLAGHPAHALAGNLMQCVNALELSFNEMLEVSRLDAGVIVARREPVSVAALCRALDASFGPQAEARGLMLRFRPGAHWISADPALMERLLGNLVHNALKFTANGGVLLAARKRGEQVLIEVWDTGSGIPAAELPRIFDEFYQVGNPERDRARGLGMGLAIVRRLADLMGLQVDVRSRPGRGTLFRLQALACAPAAAQPRVEARPAGHDTGHPGLCVMVIDDEPQVRASTAAVLEQAGMLAVTADGAQQAHAVLQTQADRAQPVDILVCDFRLRGEEDGLALIASLRAAAGRPLPALLITGDTAPDRVQRARASGLPVLYKPVPAEALLGALNAVFSEGDR